MTVRRVLLPALLLPVMLVVVLAGCASPVAGMTSPSPTVADDRPLADLDLVADPRTYVGPSTAVLASETIVPVAVDPAQTLPAQVVSHDPRGDLDIPVTDTSRVIGLDLAGSIASTIQGLGFGDTLVGRDVSTTFPEAADLPVVTSGGHTIDAESVLKLRPTLILTDGSIGPRDVLRQLRESGVTVVFVANDASFAGAADLARSVAAAFGSPDVGELLATRIQVEVDAKIAEIAAIAPTEPGKRVRMIFLYLRGGSGIYYLFGEQSGADQLIGALGGVDVAAEIGWDGEKPMTDEAMV
ncbi:MAG: ABC transporter substrate-binding protein, partial [Pseudolysinimonas sp.]